MFVHQYKDMDRAARGFGLTFQPFTFSQESLFFISRGQVHAFDVHPDIRGYLLLFTTDYLEKNLIHSAAVTLYRLYNYHLHAPVMQLEETKGERLHQLFEEIKREYANPDFFVKEAILRLF